MKLKEISGCISLFIFYILLKLVAQCAVGVKQPEQNRGRRETAKSCSASMVIGLLFRNWQFTPKLLYKLLFFV